MNNRFFKSKFLDLYFNFTYVVLPMMFLKLSTCRTQKWLMTEMPKTTSNLENFFRVLKTMRTLEE